MNSEIDPSIADEWFALVGRWKDAEADLNRLDAADPDYDAKSNEARAELRAIKCKMDELISRAKLSRPTGSPEFVLGSIKFMERKEEGK